MEPNAGWTRRRSGSPIVGRRTAGSRRHAEPVLRGTYAHGWLCFDSDKEKRRLTPIPYDWTTCSDELLEVYERHAEPVGGPHGAFGFAGEEPLAETG